MGTCSTVTAAEHPSTMPGRPAEDVPIQYTLSARWRGAFSLQSRVIPSGWPGLGEAGRVA